MSSLKKYCEKNGLDENKTFNMIVGQGGGILPQKVGMQGYIAEITDTSIICSNDKLKVKKEIPMGKVTEGTVKAVPSTAFTFSTRNPLYLKTPMVAMFAATERKRRNPGRNLFSLYFSIRSPNM